jgi:ribosomal protein S26
MIACDRCGLHVPEDEAIHRNGKHYCSEEHAREERH